MSKSRQIEDFDNFLLNSYLKFVLRDLVEEVCSKCFQFQFYCILGVPFGEVSFVKEWLKVSGSVEQPARQHPKKPVKGLDSTRREISGQRFYTFFQQLCGGPEDFFKNCLVYNHCPLMFVSESGKNLTPPDLKIETRNTLLKLCDETLVSVLDLFAVKHIIALGRYAEARAKKVVFRSGKRNIKVHFMVHPSPASAIANRGWSQLAQSALEKADLLDIIKGESVP